MLGPSEMEPGQFPPLPGSALWPWPQNALSLCPKNIFVHHTDYGSSFLSALVLYLPEYVPKFCRSELNLNRRVHIFCWFSFWSTVFSSQSHSPYHLILTPTPYTLTRPCTSIVTKICAFRSERAMQPDPGMLLSHQQLLGSAVSQS